MLYIIERPTVLIVIKPEQHPAIIPVLQHIYKNMYLLPTCFLMTRKVIQEFAAPIFLKCCDCFGSKDHLSHEKKHLTFLYTGCLIGILTMASYDPNVSG